MKKKIKILLFLLLSIKCQLWWDEVNGHEIDDSQNGFAGDHPKNFSDFFLNLISKSDITSKIIINFIRINSYIFNTRTQNIFSPHTPVEAVIIYNH